MNKALNQPTLDLLFYSSLWLIFHIHTHTHTYKCNKVVLRNSNHSINVFMSLFTIHTAKKPYATRLLKLMNPIPKQVTRIFLVPVCNSSSSSLFL